MLAPRALGAGPPPPLELLLLLPRLDWLRRDGCGFSVEKIVWKKIADSINKRNVNLIKSKLYITILTMCNHL
jgi:hypothetical protein